MSRCLINHILKKIQFWKTNESDCQCSHSPVTPQNAIWISEAKCLGVSFSFSGGFGKNRWVSRLCRASSGCRRLGNSGMVVTSVGGTVSCNIIYERVLSQFTPTPIWFILCIPETGKDPRERLKGARRSGMVGSVYAVAGNGYAELISRQKMWSISIDLAVLVIAS